MTHPSSQNRKTIKLSAKTILLVLEFLNGIIWGVLSLYVYFATRFFFVISIEFKRILLIYIPSKSYFVFEYSNLHLTYTIGILILIDNLVYSLNLTNTSLSFTPNNSKVSCLILNLLVLLRSL